jgi:heme-degrading monooxygenase HmoA
LSVLEVARVTCVEGRGDEFIERLKAGLKVQAADPECLGVYFQRCVERPDEFLLALTWTSVEAHNDWRTAHREEWRAHVMDLVVEGWPQLLGHYQTVAHVKELEGAPA